MSFAKCETNPVKGHETTAEPSCCPKLVQETGCEQSKPVEPVKVIRIGTRKSKLALIQAELVREHLNSHYNSENEHRYEFELVPISTKGDKILDVPLANIGSKALFTKELEVALLENEIDLIVHSCKDLPTNLPPGLCISAILRWAVLIDCLFCAYLHTEFAIERIMLIGKFHV